MLHVLDKYKLFLGGGLGTCGCTPQANFHDFDKEDFFNSTEIERDNVQLQRLTLMRLDHQSPVAIFVNGRILASGSVFEVFSPPQEGQWNRVDFDGRPFRDGTGLVNLSGTIYYIFLQYLAF